MKKVLPIIVILCILLTGCVSSSRTNSDAQMATKVASILTQMPQSEQTTTPPGQSQPKDVPTETATATETTVPTDTTVPTETAVPATATATVTETATAEPTATVDMTTTPQSGGGGPTPTPGGPTAISPANDPRNLLGSPTSTDPMDNPDKWVWPTGFNDFSGITFGDGYLTLTGMTPDSGWRLPLTQSSPNMYIEMTVRPGHCAGRDNYGIMFRVPNFRNANQGYLFAISCEGTFAVWKWDGLVPPKGKTTMLQYWTPNSAIVPGSDQTNRLGVLTQNDHFSVYANGTKLGEVHDPSYRDGAFGVFVNPDKTQNFSVKIDEMSYWLNPVFH